MADNRKLLTGLELKDFIMHKGARGKKLTEYQKKMNKSISKVRYIVEQLFGMLKGIIILQMRVSED